MDIPDRSSLAGEQLRQAREARQLSLAQAGRATHIRPYYLEALESGRFDLLPSQAQGRGFLRAYAQFLGLDPEMLSILLAQAGDQASPPLEAQPAPAVPPPPGEAETIFVELGAQLRVQRQRLGLSLEDIERHTHIRVFNLNALEQGNLKALPSSVQARGMLSNYASFLGMDPDPVLLRFAEGLQAELFVRRSKPSARGGAAAAGVRQPSSLRRLLSVDFFIMTFLVIFLVGFLSWGALRISDMRANQTPTATSPSIAEVLSQGEETDEPASGVPGATETPDLEVQPSLSEEDTTPEPSGEETRPTATPTVFTVTSGSAVQVNIIARQRAWMRVSVDAEVVFEGRVTPGSVYVFSGSKLVEILTGSGAALQVFYNQQDLGLLGILGEVVNRTFTPAGVENPTPSPTPPVPPAPTPTLPAGLVFPTPVAP